MEFEGRARIRPGFDIAPLVDVVFLLHIFFLLTMTYIAPQGLDVTLPAAKEAARPTAASGVTVLVDRDDQVVLDGEAVPLDELRERLAPRFAVADKPPALVAADARATVQAMVGVLDALRAAGAKELSVVTQPEAHR